MSVLSVDTPSEILGFQTTYQAIVPQKRFEDLGILYLLHGLFGDDKQWIQSSSIIRYAEEHHLAVFMPNVHRSYYTNMKSGGNYWTFLTSEFPEMIRTTFHLQPNPDRTFVGGLSMGGYGALKWGLSEPKKFSKVFGLSSAVDIARMRRDNPERNEEFNWIFGSESDFGNSSNDLFALVDQMNATNENPVFLQICGTEDAFYQDNLKFAKKMRMAGYSYTLISHEGDHNWDFWEAEIGTALNWLDGRGK
jgi:putative lysine transport system ATP-binding protein